MGSPPFPPRSEEIGRRCTGASAPGEASSSEPATSPGVAIHRPPPRPRLFSLRGSWWLGAVALLATGGCVRVYQPMSGLHDPVVVDPQLPNFTGLRVGVRCLPGGVLSPQEASGMCDKIGSLFENQGAIVRTWTTPGPVPDDDPFPTDDPDAPPPPADLTMQLRSREIHHSEYPLSWVVSIVSFTLVPAIIEETFSHDIEVRDGSGFLLSRDELQGRIVQYFGAGTWIGNTVLDLTLRSDEEELTGLRANEHLSADFYAQLSQALFDAHMRARVLGAQVEVTP